MEGPTWENPIKSFFRHERTSAGDMPCDGPWPSDRVATFKQWIDAGTPKG
jgi:hypothetical protein